MLSLCLMLKSSTTRMQKDIALESTQMFTGYEFHDMLYPVFG